MNKQKLAASVSYHVRLDPLPWRRTITRVWLPPIDDDWLVEEVSAQGIVRLGNLRTGHFATFGPDRIHHFELEPHRDWNGCKHGLFVLNVQLVLW